MDLTLTAEESAFRDDLRRWLASNVPQDWNEWREKPLEESFSYLRAWQRKLHEEMADTGFDESKIMLLIYTNWIRTFAFLFQAIIVVAVIMNAVK